MRPRSGALPFALLAAVSLGAVGVALVSQHRFGMEPCAWCVLQRLLFVAIGSVALLGLVVSSSRAATRVAGALALLLAAAGIAAALWQHLVAAKSASCNLTLADRIVNAAELPALLPSVFEVRASCADAATQLLGVSYDLWSMATFAICAVLAGRTLARLSTSRATDSARPP